MNNKEQQVKEFHQAFKQYTGSRPQIPPKEVLKLRLELILEELKELAEASGMALEFNELMVKKIETSNAIKDLQANPVKVLDALCDLQYVLSGTVLAFGMQYIFDTGFNEVHRSNMSKGCVTELEALETIEYYQKQNVLCHHEYDFDSMLYLVYRNSDKKVLKSIKYSPANLKQFLEN